MIIYGRALKVGDDISTDEIIPGKYTKTLDIDVLVEHVFEDLDPELAKVCRGRILVAGKNFGIGSSREHAPIAIKQAGVSCILAESVPRIFFRNAINVGLWIFVCDTSTILDGDELRVNYKTGKVENLSIGVNLNIGELPAVMQAIIDDGGLVEHFRMGKTFDDL